MLDALFASMIVVAARAVNDGRNSAQILVGGFPHETQNSIYSVNIMAANSNDHSVAAGITPLLQAAERLPSADWLLRRRMEGDFPYATRYKRLQLLSDIGQLLSYVGQQPYTPLGKKLARLVKEKQIYLVKTIIEENC